MLRALQEWREDHGQPFLWGWIRNADVWIRGGLISLWLYKENNKLRDWKHVFTSHIPPWDPHTYDFVVLTSLTHPRKILLVVLQIGKARLLSTPTYRPPASHSVAIPASAIKFPYVLTTVQTSINRISKVVMKSSSFWHATPCSPLKIQPTFRRNMSPSSYSCSLPSCWWWRWS
jgi:hypothetical protein